MSRLQYDEELQITVIYENGDETIAYLDGQFKTDVKE